MSVNNSVSEQLFNCSDIYARLHRQLAPQTPNPDPTPAPFGPSRAARLPHRPLSALRQARLPLRLRSRSRSQILFVGQLPQWPPATPIPRPAPPPPIPTPFNKLPTRPQPLAND